MAKEFAKAFYKSKAWLSCRASYIAKRIAVDGGMCEKCHREPGYIVHHKKKLTPRNITNPNVALNHEHLEYVCKNCHDIEHYSDIFKGKDIKNCCKFDSDGQPLPPLRK